MKDIIQKHNPMRSCYTCQFYGKCRAEVYSCTDWTEYSGSITLSNPKEFDKKWIPLHFNSLGAEISNLDLTLTDKRYKDEEERVRAINESNRAMEIRRIENDAKDLHLLFKVLGHNCPGLQEYQDYSDCCAIPCFDEIGRTVGGEDVNVVWIKYCPFCGVELDQMEATR